MTLNRQGTRLLLNCHDKTIRLYEVRRRPPGAAGHTLEEVAAALAGKQQVRVAVCRAGGEGKRQGQQVRVAACQVEERARGRGSR
jgi:5-deoxy-D-glucuronate isomerase